MTDTYTPNQQVEVSIGGIWMPGVVVSETRPGTENGQGVYLVQLTQDGATSNFNGSRMRVPEPKPVGRPAFFDEERKRLDVWVPESLKAEFKRLPGSMSGNLIIAMKAYIAVKKRND